MKVAFIGLGKLGLPCAEEMSKHHEVTGWDIKPVCPVYTPVAASLAEAVQDKELIFVAVPTPHDPEYGGETPTSHLPPKDFDYGIVQDVLREISQNIKFHQIIVLISTVLPGTIRPFLSEYHERLLYNPYLIAMGTVKEDFLDPEMIIIGAESHKISYEVSVLQRFYEPMIKNSRYVIGTWEEAEATKIFYNVMISAKLALVNMIQDTAEKIGHMNVDVVTDALAKSTKRIVSPAYMTAGLGDGGACHPRDLIALRFLDQNFGYDLFGSIMEAREAQAENMALTALRHGSHVLILGKAYKAGVSLTDGSCSLLTGYYIERHGGTVSYFDPRTGDTDIPEADVVYLIAFWDNWTMSFPFKDGSTLVDPWRKFPKHDKFKVIHYGDTR